MSIILVFANKDAAFYVQNNVCISFIVYISLRQLVSIYPPLSQCPSQGWSHTDTTRRHQYTVPSTSIDNSLATLSVLLCPRVATSARGDAKVSPGDNQRAQLTLPGETQIARIPSISCQSSPVSIAVMPVPVTPVSLASSIDYLTRVDWRTFRL